MKSLLDGSFKYTPVRDQGPDYLRKKFEKIRREQQAVKKEQEQKVASLQERKQRNG
jgi:hypothetical protein